MILTVLVLALASCKKDKCQTTTCPAGQKLERLGDECYCIPDAPCDTFTCYNGAGKVFSDDTCSCLCTYGYIGQRCEKVNLTVVGGTYAAVDTSIDDDVFSYNATIALNTGTGAGVVTRLFDDFFTNPVSISMADNIISIADQAPDNNDFSIYGTGTVTPSGGSTVKIVWTYTIYDSSNPSDQNTVRGTWTK